MQATTWARTNIFTLTADRFTTYVNNELLPLIRASGEYSKPELKVLFFDSDISRSTGYYWLRRLGFEYRAAKKSYYTKSHERADTIIDRITSGRCEGRLGARGWLAVGVGRVVHMRNL